MLLKSLSGTLKRNWRALWSFAAPAIDAGIAFASCIIGLAVSYPEVAIGTALASNWRFVGFALILFLSFNLARGVYRKFAFISLARQFAHAGMSFAYTVALVFSVYFLTRNAYYPQSYILTSLMILPAIYVPSWVAIRAAAAKIRRRGYGRWNTMLIGPEEELTGVVRRIENHPELGYDVRSVLHTPHQETSQDQWHVDPKRVEAAIGRHKIELVVFSSAHMNGSLDELLSVCRHGGTAVRLVSTESDFLFSRARLRDFAGIPLYTPPRTRIEEVKRLVKRAVDILGSTLGLVVFSPVFLMVAMLTKIESAGPVFFKQRRSLSDDSPPFDFYKFRTMHHLADERKDELNQLNESNGALFKVKKDPRLTRIGSLIRRHSIDELPQLINVLKGEMSLVGPRPLPVDDFKRITSYEHMGGYYRQRARVKPGMTGLWQISGRSDLGFREMVLLDLYYIENQSIVFDLEILLQTIPVVLFGKGAY